VGFMGKRTGASSRPGGQGGFTLVEVIVAGVIMVMVLVPSAMLLSSSAKVLTVTQSKIVAANLAAGVLDEDRALADAKAWSGSPIAPTLPAPAASSVNGVAFGVTRTTGWCTLAGGVWTSYASVPTTPVAYGVLVTVTWLAQAHSLSAGAVLTTPGAVVLAGPGLTGGAPSAGTCPL
jgi:type II secretory pathway pseudopilin PulG